VITLARMIDHLGGRYHEAQKSAIIVGDRVVTYAEMRDEMWKFARVLERNGVRPGSRVAALMSNREQYLELFAALSALNASLSPVNIRFVAREVAAAVEYIRPGLFVVDVDFERLARESLEQVSQEYRPPLLVVQGVGLPLEEDLTAQAAAAEPIRLDYPADPETCSYLAFTGGTTGVRKAAVIPAGHFYGTARQLALHLGLTRDDVTMTCGSFSHTMPFYYSTAQLYCGGTVVVLPKFTGQIALETIMTRQVSWFAAVPTMYSDMIQAASEHVGLDVSSVRRYASSGAPLPTAIKSQLMQLFGRNFFEYYGATELGWVTTLEPRDQLRKHRCVGQPMPGTDIVIRDTRGSDVPTGEIGVIWTRGDVLMTGYFDRDEDTKQVTDGEWATAGDVGYLDEEGYLFLVDRQKDMIVSGGINVYPAEIEEVLMKVPGAIEVACIGIPDPRWGEAVQAVCVVAGSRAAWEECARRAVAQELASYKRPKSYQFTDELPHSHAGKVLKRVLREPYWASQERRI
jgi:acyl-CoA synthetase (AMP-forming)/AMP-acid ligase II